MTRPLITPAGARQWTLEHRERPMTMNEYRRLHHHPRADYDREVRTYFGWVARAARIGRLQAVIVTAVPVVRAGTSLPDVAACYPAVKAAVDGLVDAKVIPDDTPRYVHALTFIAPEHGPQDLLLLLVEEVLDGVG